MKATPRQMRRVWGLLLLCCLVFWVVVIGGVAWVVSS